MTRGDMRQRAGPEGRVPPRPRLLTIRSPDRPGSVEQYKDTVRGQASRCGSIGQGVESLLGSGRAGLACPE
jgi:hypothetical protein